MDKLTICLSVICVAFVAVLAGVAFYADRITAVIRWFTY